ncbi:E3 ubiquitin-protein ligase march5 [Cichlidogyrus casuarinus]|uniref:E3 ubiquitin-protein ligase MARCHF5 n=1 Tax=Cichlidogyrus casuarinus TaxID=1844966 RepID=A0ABD2Q2X6_9PLAT
MVCSSLFSEFNDPKALEHGFRIGSPMPIIEYLHSNSLENEDRICWVCFCRDSDNETQDAWCHPCNCKGSTKWVHQSCLQRWIDSKQSSADFTPVACKACNFEYILIHPKPSREGFQIITNQDTLKLFVLLPSIPFLLFFSKIIDWKPMAATFYRRVLLNIFPISLLRPTDIPSWRLEDYYKKNTWTPQPSRFTEALAAAVTFPTMANITGNFLFSNYQSQLKRSLLGGLVFILSKGFLDIALDEMKFYRASKRQVQDHYSVL